MPRQHLVDIPPVWEKEFHGAIAHPQLWLWDAWTCEIAGTLHLFTLALARWDRHGKAILPEDRNNFPFHIRRFSSRDGGQHWRDCGHYLSPSPAANGVMAHNVWSGSAAQWREQLLFGFTGIRQPEPERSFVQSICVAVANLDGTAPHAHSVITISDPERDYDHIVQMGYYLGEREQLGSNAGEHDGPILAWRDPYLLVQESGQIDAFWSAKTSPRVPAVAHARITPKDDGFDTELLPPIILPDAQKYTQAEVPKIYPNRSGNGYILLLSTCDRLHEKQPDDEVSKVLRLYHAPSLRGPWQGYWEGNNIIPDTEHLFGGSIASFDEKTGDALLIAPYTEMAATALQLTFAPPLTVSLALPKTDGQRAMRSA